MTCHTRAYQPPETFQPYHIHVHILLQKKNARPAECPACAVQAKRRKLVEEPSEVDKRLEESREEDIEDEVCTEEIETPNHTRDEYRLV